MATQDAKGKAKRQRERDDIRDTPSRGNKKVN
jgi:hypothetical protein